MSLRTPAASIPASAFLRPTDFEPLINPSCFLPLAASLTVLVACSGRGISPHSLFLFQAETYKVGIEDIYLVHDDVDKPLGKIAMKLGGSARYKGEAVHSPVTGDGHWGLGKPLPPGCAGEKGTEPLSCHCLSKAYSPMGHRLACRLQPNRWLIGDIMMAWHG